MGRFMSSCSATSGHSISSNFILFFLQSIQTLLGLFSNMPRAKNVRSLRTLCLRNIAFNMDDLWVPLARGHCPEVFHNQEDPGPAPRVSSGQASRVSSEVLQESDGIYSCTVLCKNQNQDVIGGPFSDLSELYTCFNCNFYICTYICTIDI